MSGLKKEMLRG